MQCICDAIACAPSTVAATGGPTMALPKMDLPAGKERKGPIPDMDSIHRWGGILHFTKLDPVIY